MLYPKIRIDCEVTNRCNADCNFCPRDMTPHQGLMEPEVFEQTLARTIELRDGAAKQAGLPVDVVLCGLGEPLLNRHCFDYVRQVREAGMQCSFSSNGALLDEKKARRLLDAGVNEISFNVGDKGADYEAIYSLRWDKTFENVVRFAEMAKGQCDVTMILVDHRRDPAHIREMEDFWREHGITATFSFPVINRGGSLFVEGDDFDANRLERLLPEVAAKTKAAPLCAIPFYGVFVGYDGQLYLCCSDWQKKTAMGSVFDKAFMDVMAEKIEYVRTRTPVCHGCTMDPLNRVAGVQKAVEDGEVGRWDYGIALADAVKQYDGVDKLLRKFEIDPPESIELPREEPEPTHRRLPIVAVDR